MGPTNQALLHLYEADTALRRAKDDLDRATRGVRVQKKRADLALAGLRETHESLQRLRAKSMEVDGDLRHRDEHIEHLRLQQQEATNTRQYQALLQQLVGQKAERDRVQEQGIAHVTEIERLQQLETEQRHQAKAEAERAAEAAALIGDRTSQLQAVIDDLQPKRDGAAAGVAKDLVVAYERLADNYDGEALAPIGHIDGKEERYYCTACNMELVVDVYNRLTTRDDVVMCPGCGRILFIPIELTPEMAVRHRKKPVRRVSRAKAATPKPAKIGRNGLSADVDRILSTAAAESLREAQLDGTTPCEAYLRLQGVKDPVGPFVVASEASFAQLVQAKTQAANVDLVFEVLSSTAISSDDVRVGQSADESGAYRPALADASN